MFLLRIEDSDRTRSRDDYVGLIEDDLEWIGLRWDEGEGAGGDAGPYRQSARHDIYRYHFERLEASDRAYPCFCSADVLERARAAQAAAGEPPRYPGTCAALSRAAVAERISRGERPALRFRVPPGREIAFDDLVRGAQRFRSGHMGDFVIRRADGSPAFLFANALDDALMGVTDVLRGEDHLSNTPRQLLLLEALELAAPRYGHLPLITGTGGAPLSKRAQSASIAGLRAEGYLPAAVVNYAARLGHPFADSMLLDLEGLAREFDCARLAHSAARFDAAQLRFWQRQAVAASSEATLREWMEPAVSDLVPPAARADFVRAVRGNVLLLKDALHWARILFADRLETEEEARAVIDEAGAEFYRRAIEALAHRDEDFRACAKRLEAASRRRGRALFRPLRAALTGTLDGPELGALRALMGPERVRRRLASAAAESGVEDREAPG